VLHTQRTEFQAHDLEIGFHYESDALVGDGTPPPPVDPMGCDYHPTTRPGHRLPHAWLERGGTRLSTHDLVGRGGFALLTGPAGSAWVDAAERAAHTLGVPVHAVRIGAECADPDGDWARVREISDAGAVLVRPDNHVAFRSPGAVDDPAEVLRHALATVLGR
jgi:2,4-dichlorophenol 6-monooxygenase